MVLLTPKTGGTGGASTLGDLTDVSTDGVALNDTIKWNGSEFVAAGVNESFAFAIAGFSDGQSTTLEIGSGVWKAAGALSFSASYTNGPATGGYVSHSGWSNLTLEDSFTGPTVSTEAVNYPESPGGKSFTLHAAKDSESDTSTITHTFVNRVYYGVSSTASGYAEADVEGLAGNTLSNSLARSFTVAPGSGEYILYAYPARLGAATFTVGGFEGGFQDPETVSVTNASGYTEDYYVYRSANTNLGSTTVTVS